MSIPRPKRASRRSESPSKARGSKSGSPKGLKWKDLVGEQKDSLFAAYTIEATFAPNQLVLHAKFGKGIVTELEAGKVTILFEDGARKLLQEQKV